jgi:aspartyl-tRNA(Asn)/glutamyl-tRNA(Gln) amidotransferase subunit A
VSKTGIPGQNLQRGIHQGVQTINQYATEFDQSAGHNIVNIFLNMMKCFMAACHVIAAVNASFNLGRLDGIKYGCRSKNATDAIDGHVKTDGEGCGEEANPKIML